MSGMPHTLFTRLLTLGLLALSLGGCALLPGTTRQPVTHYILTDPGPLVFGAYTHPGVLLLREMDVPAFYQVPRLAYSNEAGTRSHYEYARWSEPIGQRLTWLLRQRIEAAKVFDSVASLGSGVLGDYQINTRLVDFFHESATPPGVVLLVLEVELIQRDSARLIGHRLFVSQIPVARHEAAAAADAMGIAANQVIDELILWLEQSAGK
jgi:cholesterol transport system auxiliary component